jgi:glycerophosphoryl diester phosphodiesterase
LTNSYDAFAFNYDRGFRVFEVDFRLTGDGYLAAVHDWGSYFRDTLGMPVSVSRKAKPLSLPVFQMLRIDGKYRPLVLTDLVALLEQYPDVYLVTDTKERSASVLERGFRQIAAAFRLSPVPGVQERVVPQIYNRAMYRMLEAIHPFSYYIYTLYDSEDSNEQVVEFVRRTPKIRAVAMPDYRVTQPFVARLKKSGVQIYVHTINDPGQYAKLRKMGVDGVYTDFLDPRHCRERP